MIPEARDIADRNRPATERTVRRVQPDRSGADEVPDGSTRAPREDAEGSFAMLSADARDALPPFMRRSSSASAVVDDARRDRRGRMGGERSESDRVPSWRLGSSATRCWCLQRRYA